MSMMWTGVSACSLQILYAVRGRLLRSIHLILDDYKHASEDPRKKKGLVLCAQNMYSKVPLPTLVSTYHPRASFKLDIFVYVQRGARATQR